MPCVLSYCRIFLIYACMCFLRIEKDICDTHKCLIYAYFCNDAEGEARHFSAQYFCFVRTDMHACYF